jgi:hypothetical protein
MKVLLVSTNRLSVPFPVYPLGLDHVAGVLEDRHEVVVLDLLADERPDALEATLRTTSPDVVGLSLRNIDNTDDTAPVSFVANARGAVETVRRSSSARVVLGGSGFGIFPKELLTTLGADAGIVGEGERLSALLDAWARARTGRGFPARRFPAETSCVHPRGTVPGGAGGIRRRRTSGITSATAGC